MGTAIVVFHQAGNRSVERQSVPVIRLPGARTEVITTDTVSTQTQLDADGFQETSSDGAFVTVFALDVNLWVTSGEDPIAVKPGADETGAGFPIMAGTNVTFAIDNDDMLALIEWS